MPLTVIGLLIIISFPSPTLSFHSRLKTFLLCKSFPLQPFFSSSGLTTIPQIFTVTSEYIHFYFLVFLFYTF